MTTIKLYKARQYYTSKYGDKCYVDEDGGDTYITAALLTGKGLNSEKALAYTVYGENKEDADKALASYLKANELELEDFIIETE